MTRRERRIAELAAQDLENWASELPLGSETRRDLQQTARAYRFAARAGASAVPLRVVRDNEAQPHERSPARQAASSLAAERSPDAAVSARAPGEAHPPLKGGA